MINKLHRFHGHNSLNFAYRKGRTFKSGNLSLKAAPSKRADFRLAVVVSRKVSKSAVVRNRIRRRIYEIVRLKRMTSPNPWAFDLIITVFDEEVAEMPHSDLLRCIDDLFKKANI